MMYDMFMDIHKQHVILTGGSNGIGLALATLLASHGARVHSLDIEHPTKNMDGVTHIHCDVSKLDDVRAALAQVGGAIDLLILNAGVIRRGPILSHPENEFDLVFNVNTKGTWLMLKEGIPLLSKHATILYVSSYRADQSPNDPGLYAVSKAASEHLVRCATLDTPDVTVKIARIGNADTAMARYDLSEEAVEQKKGRMRPPEEIATLLLQLTTSNDRVLSYDPLSDQYAFGA